MTKNIHFFFIRRYKFETGTELKTLSWSLQEKKKERNEFINSLFHKLQLSKFCQMKKKIITNKAATHQKRGLLLNVYFFSLVNI